jgi:hypothetical protein
VQATYGAFYIEDRSGTGQPWTADDEERLRGIGRYSRVGPHVHCNGAIYYIGSHTFSPGGEACFRCRAPKVSRRHTDHALFCFGCGALQ